MNRSSSMSDHVNKLSPSVSSLFIFHKQTHSLTFSHTHYTYTPCTYSSTLWADIEKQGRNIGDVLGSFSHLLYHWVSKQHDGMNISFRVTDKDCKRRILGHKGKDEVVEERRRLLFSFRKWELVWDLAVPYCATKGHQYATYSLAATCVKVIRERGVLLH